MKKKHFSALMLLSVFYSFSIPIFAQTIVRGTVKDPEYNESLAGASVVVKGTTQGTATDLNGVFELEVEKSGNIELLVSFVGYEDKTIPINATGKTVNLGTIMLKQNAIGVLEINVIADRAKERETPVAFSTLRKKDIEGQLGSRDIPLILNVTPSVYATQQGGGAGDARINVRGFNQNNIAIMINGVPVNDMENGWVYWSNWDGIADATSSIQLQRGLSAVNLATPSVGGTMNILTSPAEHDAGGIVKYEYGSGNFTKASITGNTGLIKDKFALSASLIRKVGQGVIDKTYTDAWAYYFGASYIVNKNHRLELFALGAPQQHGQNLYMQNLAAYSHKYAKELGADDETLSAFPESSSGRLYNENWNSVNTSYAGKQYRNGKEMVRHDDKFIGERENYYHKPLINMNWYARWSDKINQYTTLYYSGGKGGGSGAIGSIAYDYNSEPSRIVDWNGTLERNTVSDTAFGVLRNSVNEQWTIGAISKVRINFTENLRSSIGIDWRTAKIDHFREIRDLLGGQFYVSDDNEFDSPADYNKQLGDKIAYYFTNTVDWIGYFAQLEYSNEVFTAYGTFGNSFIKYGYTNHFVEDENNPGKELSANSDYIAGFQVKGGVSYRPAKTINIFANYGYVSKAPVFDNVINDQSAVVTDNTKNELFNSFEFGVSYTSPMRDLEIKANYYYTSWTDKAQLQRITNPDGSEGYVFISGMDELHQGVELEASYKPVQYIGLGAFASLGNWKYTDDVSGTYKNYDNVGTEESVQYTYYVKDLKVGDAPQTQFGILVAAYPIKRLKVQVDFRYNDNYYANWDPFSRTKENDRSQVWKTPSYYLFDLHASYQFALGEKINAEIFGHIFNLLDEIYIQDATDNSQYNGFYGDNRFSHDVNTAEVFVGLPRTFNIGAKIMF
jgi:iron complex outermembrane recepter protein